MDSKILIALAVIAAAVWIALLVRSKKPTLPSEEEHFAQREESIAAHKPTAAAPAAHAPTPSLAPLLDAESIPAPPAPPPAPRAPKRTTPEDVDLLKRRLATTRGAFIARLVSLFSDKSRIDPRLIDDIEEVLISADIGVKVSQRILERLRDRVSKHELTDTDRIWSVIREEALAVLKGCEGGMKLDGKKPAVITVIGVNGVGKTTTIGKLASRFTAEGKKVVLAAGDTFRAAAVLQLEVWGKRVGCSVAKGNDKADPSAVIFDAIRRAQADGADIVIVDTAGRLHTKLPLMEELKKVDRTIEKALGRPADEVLLVLDATTGQNALQQAQLFRDAVPVSGIVLTKLDGTAKGGVVLGIVDQHKVPIRFIGIGERIEELREFDAASFVEALFERPEDTSSAA